MGKHLKMYGMKFGGGLINSDNFSKVLEYSRGDAARFTRNVINIRMGNHKFNLAGGLKDLKTYFADTEFLKKQVINPEIERIKASITERLQERTQEGIQTLSEKARKKLESALSKITRGQANVDSVSDDNDFNSQNIQQAKKDIAEGTKEAAEVLGSSANTGDGESVNITEEAAKIKKQLNHMRKISMEQFEEQFGAELCIENHTYYKYTQTLTEMCEWLQSLLADLGIKKELKPEEYPTPESLEAMVIAQLNKKKLKYTQVEIEEIGEFDETEYDPD